MRRRRRGAVRERHVGLREGLAYVLERHERIEKVVLCHPLVRGQVPIGGAGGVAIPEQHILKPFGHHERRGHQVTDALEDRLEVILLGLAAHEHVEALVHVRPSPLRLRQSVQMVLGSVEAQAQLANLASQLPVRFTLAGEDVALLVGDVRHLRATHAHEPDALWKGRRRRVRGRRAPFLNGRLERE